MCSRSYTPGMRRTLLAGAFALLLAACGGGVDVDLSEAGARGKSVFDKTGCATCHGSDAGGGAGPSLHRLAGSDVELADGTTVVADDDYLRLAITDPSAQIVAGTSLQMTQYPLSDDEVDDLIAYIHDLAAVAG